MGIIMTMVLSIVIIVGPIFLATLVDRYAVKHKVG
jgi:hypothetical protein